MSEEVRLLFAGDLHKRPKDISTINGYVECNTAVQRSLMDLIVEKGVDYFFSLGDWYDKGYTSDIAASLVDYDLDIKLANLVHGNFYGVIGNHIRLGMDSNPELHLIQPHPVLKSRRRSSRSEQILKTPEFVRINDVQISLMHYKMEAESVAAYKPKREPWAKYHIALFHTDMIIPMKQLVNTNYGFTASSGQAIGDALEGVDLAIVGHVHNTLGMFNVGTPSGQVPMIVPGSLTNVDSGEKGRHSMVALPFITVSADSEVKIQFINFDIKTNMVTFKKKNVDESREKLKSLRGKSVEDIHETEDVVAVLGNKDEALLSLNAFMQVKNYTRADKALVRSVLKDPKDLKSLVQVYLDEGNDGFSLV